MIYLQTTMHVDIKYTCMEDGDMHSSKLGWSHALAELLVHL